MSTLLAPDAPLAGVAEIPAAAAEDAPANRVSVRNLSKHFGAFVAVNDVSLDVREGEFLCILGPSGCGKTTVLRAIAGLDIQTYGQIFLAGRDVSALPPAERDFGIVFQSYALFPNLTVRQNVAYGLENRRMGRAEIASRVEELLAVVGLEDQAGKHPARLSGGQQQRVALARALAPAPGLLLLDEPLSALDAKVRARLRVEMKDLQLRLGITTIMVTHDQEEALTLADRLVVMNRGRVEQVGTPREIYRAPATAFVADFIGQMNFLPGRCAGLGSVICGGVTLRCPPAELEAASGGESVLVALRPEDIVLESVAAAAPGESNRLAAEVRAVEFLGPALRLQLAPRAAPGVLLVAELPAAAAADLALRPGAEVTARLPAERLRVYPGAGGG